MIGVMGVREDMGADGGGMGARTKCTERWAASGQAFLDTGEEPSRVRDGVRRTAQPEPPLSASVPCDRTRVTR